MTDSNELTTELDSMAIILHAGNAKSCAFEALKEVKLRLNWRTERTRNFYENYLQRTE
nr:PTS lactose/cellobiose transporter subunit IIA [Listeria monocytogenes]